MNNDLKFNITANIGEEKTRIELVENDKRLPPKTVNTIDFVRALRTVKLDEQREETPLLPGDYGTKKIIKKSDGGYILLITTPPGPVEIEYNKLNYYDIQVSSDEYDEWLTLDGDSELVEIAENELDFYLNDKGFDPNDGHGKIRPYSPSMVWMLELRPTENNMYRIVRDRVYAKDSIIFSMEDELYVSPFGNVYDRNNICWGQVPIPEVTLQGSLAYRRLFFSNYFNTDLEITGGAPFELGEYLYNARFLHLLKNESILENDGEDSAREHMNDILKRNIAGRLGDLWDEFTQ